MRGIVLLGVLCGSLGLAQREAPVKVLTVNADVCIRIMQQGRPAVEPVCKDASGRNRLVVWVPRTEAPVRYQIRPAQGAVVYIIYLDRPSARPQVVVPRPSAQPVLPPAAHPAPPAAEKAAPPSSPPAQAAPPKASLPLPSPSEQAVTALPSVPKQPLPPLPATEAPVQETAAPTKPASPAAARVPVSPPERGPRVAGLSPVIAQFSLRKSETGTRINFSLVARSEIVVLPENLWLYLDGKPIRGQLTRRTTAEEPGLLTPGQGEFGWIELGKLDGQLLQLEWDLEGYLLTREWRLR